MSAHRHLPISEQLGKGVNFVLGLATAPIYLRACQRLGRGVRTVDAPFVRNDGRIEIGEHTIINSHLGRVCLEAESGARITIGSRSFLNFGTTLRAAGDIVVGQRVYVGPRSSIGGGRSSSIVVDDDAWIGQAVTVLPGSRVGARAVIAAGSVVDGDIPPGVLAVGVPARPVRSIHSREDEEDARTLPQVGGLARLAADVFIPPARAGVRAAAAIRRDVRAALALRGVDGLGAGVGVAGRIVVHNLGRIEIGDHVEIGGDRELTHLVTGVGGVLVIGRGVRIGSGCGICAHDRVEIGADTHLGEMCSVLDTSFHGMIDRSRVARPRPVVIGSNARIGDGALVMPGTRIGDRAIVEPGSVVTRDVEAGAHVGGVPARPL